MGWGKFLSKQAGERNISKVSGLVLGSGLSGLIFFCSFVFWHGNFISVIFRLESRVFRGLKPNWMDML